ncbi:tRNA synthetase, class II [Spirochaeta dissipatitropha]
MYTCIRDFFGSLGFLEVETPSLSPAVIPETHIEVFSTEYRSWTLNMPLYLLPSPEYYMKQLLSQGSGSIFQISRCYRNAEVLSSSHLLEFNMLEWYSVDSDYMDNLAIQEQLLQFLAADSLLQNLISAHTSSREATENILARIARPIQRISMQEAFRRYADFDLESALLNRSLSDDDFHILLVDQIEPQLPRDRPVALIDYPAIVPTTGKSKPDSPWTERWELYIGGLETANCYTEASADELQEYFNSELQSLRKKGREHQADSSFPDRIRDLPKCSGNALGLDRLLMQLCGEQGIKGVILFPLHDIIRP